jgi:hypothetical protein
VGGGGGGGGGGSDRGKVLRVTVESFHQCPIFNHSSITEAIQS